MKKILLLFILFLGLSSGAFAAGEMIVDELITPSNEQPTSIIILYKDGSIDYIWDGDPCVHVYGETSGGGTVYIGSGGGC